MRPDRKKLAFRKKLQEEGKVSRKFNDDAETEAELFPDLMWVWDTFTLLNRQRQVGANGPQPISVHDIRSIAELKNITRSDDIELLLLALPELDSIVLKAHYDEVEANMKKAQKKKPPGRK